MSILHVIHWSLLDLLMISITCQSNLDLERSTKCTVAGLSSGYTALPGRSRTSMCSTTPGLLSIGKPRLNHSYGYASAQDQPGFTRAINQQFRQLVQYAG